MIRRKRVQALLHVLQVFCALSCCDGEAASQAGPLDAELSENLIDEPAPTLQTDVPHVTYQPGVEDPPSIENLTIVQVSASSVSLSWNVSASNLSMEFSLQLFREQQLLQNYTSQQPNYTLTELDACTGYRIGVMLNSSVQSEMRFVEAETSFLAPGQVSELQIAPTKSATLQVSWSMPEAVSRCVKHYQLSIDSENAPSDSAVANGSDYSFENLHACTTYYVTITPVDVNGKEATPSRSQAPSTLKEVSAPPVPYEAEGTPLVTADSSTLTWLIEDRRNNCSLHSLHSECTYETTEGWGYVMCNGTASSKLTGVAKGASNVTLRVAELSPYTHYACRARTLNEQGESEWSAAVRLRTSEDRPSEPRQFQSLSRLELDEEPLGFAWLPPRYIPGKLGPYRINFTWVPAYPVPAGCPARHSHVLEKISPELNQALLDREEACAHYYARISAKTGAGYSHEAEIQFDSRSGGRPERAKDLRCRWGRRPGDPRALDTLLDWRLPCASRGLLYQFEVSVSGARPGQENHSLAGLVDVPADYASDATFSINFGELRPLYTYQISVVATIRGGPAEPGEPAECTLEYPAGIPPQPDVEYVKSIRLDPHKARRTTSSAAILLPLFPELNGQIKYYAVMVSGRTFDNSSARFDLDKERWPNVSSWEEASQEDFGIAYQATEPMWQPFPNHVVDYGHMKAVKFVIGEDSTCPEVSSNTKTRAYCNGPLKADTWYEVRMRAFTDHGYADSVAFTIKTNAELNVGLVLGAVFGILFLGIVATLMLLVKRCSFRLLLQRIAQSNIPESPVPNPFTRSKFVNHCQQLLDNPAKLANEFQLLQTVSVDLQMPSNAACLQANRKKNRYSDILPYDFSRVKLEIIDNDPNTDYINASFIRGYSSNEEYIACQGPKEETSHDFWRMIEQYDVKMIVMLTQLVERGREKCHQYFPAIRETASYDKFSIRCSSELDYRIYTQRTLLLQKDDKVRTITHLHFKDWPDHDVPDDYDAMIQFCQMFRKQMASLKGLSVIHCSAGIGRTGTLIAIDILLQCIRDNRKLDVFGTVYRLRRHRLNMVQREKQYAYIYNCIRQVLKNPYFLKSYKPPPIDPVYTKAKKKKEKSDSSPDIVDSLDTLRKNSLSASIDSMQPLCQSSPQATPKIPMNVLFAGLRYCKSTSAIDTRSHHNRIGRYNSEGYAICGSGLDSPSSSSNDSSDEMNELKSASSSTYENVEPLIRPSSSSQTIAGSNYYLTNDTTEKDTSL